LHTENARFARGFLAEALRARVEAFQPFSRWSEIARELASRELA
jgi:hypothetical protein